MVCSLTHIDINEKKRAYALFLISMFANYLKDLIFEKINATIRLINSEMLMMAKKP